MIGNYLNLVPGIMFFEFHICVCLYYVRWAYYVHIIAERASYFALCSQFTCDILNLLSILKYIIRKGETGRVGGNN